MGILARKGETIKDRDGKVIATVASDITSGDINVTANQFEMAKGYELSGSSPMLPEEVYQFIRDRLSSPPKEDDEDTGTTKAVGQAKTISDGKRK